MLVRGFPAHFPPESSEEKWSKSRHTAGAPSLFPLPESGGAGSGQPRKGPGGGLPELLRMRGGSAQSKCLWDGGLTVSRAGGLGVRLLPGLPKTQRAHLGMLQAQ